MRKIKTFLAIGFLVLNINGCSVDEITEDFSDINAEKEWMVMCNQYTLFVCGDNVSLKDKPAVDIEEVISYDYGINVYKEDDTDHYDYLGSGVNTVLEGDCEDFAITFVENNLREGNIKPGEVKILFGRLKSGSYHVWAVVKKNGEEHIFDTNGYYGEPLEEAYANMELEYRELKILYRY